MRLFLTTAAAFVLLACTPASDIGKPCTLRRDGGVWNVSSPTDDFLDTGTTFCQNLVCIRPAGYDGGAGAGFCSNNCTPDDPTATSGPSADCDSATTGLVCRPITLDPDFVKSVEEEDGGQAILDEYLGGANTYYCATPAPAAATTDGG